MLGVVLRPSLTETLVEGSRVPRSFWPAVVVVCEGRMAGRLEMAILKRVWTGSCCVAASVVAVRAGGRGARDAVGVGSGWRGRFWCCCWRPFGECWGCVWLFWWCWWCR